MIHAQQITASCGIIFLIYWILSAQSVKPTKEIKKSLWDFRLVIIGVIIVFWFLNRLHVLRAIPFFSLLIIPQTQLVAFVSSFFAICGLIIAVIARRALGGNWSSNVELKKGHELITTGIYHSLRHPIYTGCILLAFGLVLAVGTLGMILLFLFILFFLFYKMRQEEELLLKHFPKGYGQYKKRVKALIPFVW